MRKIKLEYGLQVWNLRVVPDPDVDLALRLLDPESGTVLLFDKRYFFFYSIILLQKKDECYSHNYFRGAGLLPESQGSA
ncbi:hypothetical protein CEUSTIGMA_g11718.t1 [Chlamydomonas eustigma]|uniref:Uncharacterized protein n=1 Tax=Chlamydomonas eustigma TaxID=1157962 RepID=A0A250XMQ1_9CHLO|nr:hypothetical protein CEUSTIGMA_g11718.t1 [Chlamydomonas eustigma]|eukprot:GAX84296.1 hypothetical protein CEUSTIGMA_g11718.t1 [Chlamydomonas eustigma]